ncbi:MAG: UvrD-helicase domain-containing protein, partial [Bdellovibrionales bacterium]|nr:UvrD-helicase domain-containing protein [Bdellovibrionales bacterium]
MKSDDNSKIKRLFSFLREIHNLKTPPVASIQDYDWLQVISELPKHEALKGAFAQTDSTSELSKQYNVILEIDRPKETPCPEPPEAIRGWLSAGWKNPAKEVSFLDLRDVTKGSRVVRTEKFADSADRKKLKTSWLRKRSRWAEKEAPIREAIAVFNHFFELHSLIKKEADKYQLLLADGCLTWNSEREPLDHPILSQKVALKFDPEVPRFSVVLDPDSELKIASHILRYHGLNGQIINETKESIEAQALDLTETKKIKELLKSFVHTAFQDGVFVENAKTKFDPENPHIKPLPCLLLAKKSQSVAEVFDKLLTHLPEDSAQPAVLQRIVGLDPKDENPTAAGDFEFFQTKPANEEQFRIVQTLENTGNVLVQGPPGTGKSHTIANLIGHLLAKGKRILVTSHTSKALKVVREKVAEPLQPLCVANLSNDAESKAQLKDSVTGIVNYLSKTDTKKLEKTTAELQAKRKQIKQQLEDLESQILHVLQTEYTEINIPGEESMSPIQAAKFLDQHRESENWIPGAVDKQARLPLTEKEIADLYESNLQMDQTQEACLLDETLDLTGLPKAREFEKLSELKKKVASQTDDQMLGFFEADVEIDEQVLEDFTSELEANLQSIVGDDWTRTIFEELVIDRNRTGPWLELIEIVENTYQEITRNENLIISLDPAINFDWTEELYQASLKLSDRLYAKGKIGLVARLINPKWRFILNNSTVDGHRPNTGDEVRAISYLYKNEIDREKLIRRWKRQMGPTGAPEA